MARRVILLRHVLCSILLHIISSSRLSKSVLDILNRKMSTFLWNGRHHWRSWEAVSRPNEYGGLDIRNLSFMQQAYDYLLWWKYHHSSSFWASYSRAKYGNHTSIYSHIYDSSTWKRICRINAYMLTQSQSTQDGYYGWRTPQANSR